MSGVELRTLLDEAHAAIRDDTRGHLARPLRQRITSLLAHNHAKPVALGARCVDQLAYTWPVGAPVLADALDAARAALRGGVEGGREEIVGAGDRARAVAEEALRDWPLHANLAFAAADVCYTVAHGWVPEEPHVDDEQLEPDDWDAPFLVSLVSAGGAPSDASTDAEARRAYWAWWLRDVVPRVAAGRHAGGAETEDDVARMVAQVAHLAPPARDWTLGEALAAARRVGLLSSRDYAAWRLRHRRRWRESA